MSKCYTFYKGVLNEEELSDYLNKNGDIPECEMFQKKHSDDDELIKDSGFIQEESCDTSIFKDIPKTLREALGYNNI